MPDRKQFCKLLVNAMSQASTAALAIATVLVLVLMVTQSAQAQTFTVIHQFAGPDGGTPYAGVTIDGAGNLYGTTYAGGTFGDGTVYELAPKGTGWVLSQYRFGAPGDGSVPWAGVVFGPDGRLYGTTFVGGASNNGTVFAVSPTATICRAVTCPWTEALLYSFTGGSNSEPTLGDLVFDRSGNIYGAASGDVVDGGLVYELSRSDSGWTEKVLYEFGGLYGLDGWEPIGGVIFDGAGNLYGTTSQGGANGAGVVFKLTYSAGSGWTESVLYSFTGGNDGGEPYSGLIFDTAGNLYGSTTIGGQGSGGTVFKLTPSGTGWNYSVIYSFTGNQSGLCGPWAPLFMDSAGNLYGTTFCDGANFAGNIFRLTPSTGGWIYTSLKDFSVYGHDGSNPASSVIMDSHGNLYGTASSGGTGCQFTNCGVIWEITP